LSLARPAAQRILAIPPMDRIDDVIAIPTPEKIAFEYEIAGPVRRLIAWVLDVLLIQLGYWASVLALGLLVAWLAGLAGAITPALADLVGGLFTFVALAGSFVVYWFYGAWMEATRNGQTLGKRWTSLRVLSRDGGAISSGQAILRNLFRYADLMPIVPAHYFLFDPEITAAADFALPLPTMMTGLIVMTVLPGFRRLGDLVAGTMVVSERAGALPEPSAFDDPRVAQLAEALPGNFRVSQKLAAALASYVDRRRRLGPDRSAEIAAHIGPGLLAATDFPRDTNHDLLLCGLYYRTFVIADGARQPQGDRRK
jgi:uncharacterized RDD family membrane protein YckC